MGGGAVKQIGSFHDGLSEGRVRMDRKAHIGYIGAHFNGQNAFSDHFARAGAGDTHTDDAFAPGINDKLGHSTGDTVLQCIAQRLSSAFREMDTVSRVGGDEFFILALNIDNKKTASYMANKILEEISKPIPDIPKGISLSASIGICLFPYKGMTVSDIIDRADEAMYKVKNSGKENFSFYI